MVKLLKRPFWLTKRGQKIFNQFNEENHFRCRCGKEFAGTHEAEAHRCKFEMKCPWRWFMNGVEVSNERFHGLPSKVKLKLRRGHE